MQQGSSGVDIFLSSDWGSIRSGATWVEEIESALSCCKHFVALLTSAEDACSPWINYEIGFARGREILPRFFYRQHYTGKSTVSSTYVGIADLGPVTQTAEWAICKRWESPIRPTDSAHCSMFVPKQMSKLP